MLLAGMYFTSMSKFSDVVGRMFLIGFSINKISDNEIYSSGYCPQSCCFLCSTPCIVLFVALLQTMLQLFFDMLHAFVFLLLQLV